MVGTMRGSAASSQLGLGRTLLRHFPDPACGLETYGPENPMALDRLADIAHRITPIATGMEVERGTSQ